MRKQLTKISLVSGGNILNAILGLAYITAVAKTLPEEDFGKYALLYTTLVMISKIIDFGSNSHFVAQTIIRENELDTTKYIHTESESKNTFLTLKILLFFATLPITYVMLNILDLWSLKIFAIFVIGLLAYGMNYILFTFFQKIENFVAAVSLNTLPAVIKGGVASMIFAGMFTPTMIQAFTIFATAVISSSILLVFLPKEFRTFKFTAKGTYKLIKKTLPAGISLTITQGWPAIAGSIAKITKTFTDVGVFSIADKVASIFSLISFSIFTVLLPKNARRNQQKLGYDTKETILLSIGIILLAIGTIIIAPHILIAVFGTKYIESVDLLGILIIASALTAIHTFMDNYFFVEEKVKTLANLTIFKLAIFIATAALLIPKYSLTGLALAQLTAAAITVVITARIILKKKRA